MPGVKTRDIQAKVMGQGVAEGSGSLQSQFDKKNAKANKAAAEIQKKNFRGAQDESEVRHGWRAELEDITDYNTFEVKLRNTRSKETAHFVIRPVDMIEISGKLQIETMDVRDLQTGQTYSWASSMKAPEGAIVDAIDALFWDNIDLNNMLYDIANAHEKKGQDMLPGLKQRTKAGTDMPADAFLSGQAAIDKAKKSSKGVGEAATAAQQAAIAINMKKHHKKPKNKGVTEARIYYNVIGTTAQTLKESFKMHKDSAGWYINASAGRKSILEAHKAFGAPVLIK